MMGAEASANPESNRGAKNVMISVGLCLRRAFVTGDDLL